MCNFPVIFLAITCLCRWLSRKNLSKVFDNICSFYFCNFRINDRLILSQHIIFIITLLFALIIYKVIPQENTKKKLDIIEYKVYRKRGKCILVIELAISIVMHIIDYSIVYTHIMYSFGLIVILLCMSDGYLKRCVKDW